MKTKQFFHAFFSIAAGRWQMVLMAPAVAVLLAIFGSTVWAFPTFGDCAECHGNFRVGNYTSLQDGTDWGTNLMSGHLDFMGGNCEACHIPGSGNPLLNSSGDPILFKSCVGCHGRDEDVTGNCTGLSGSMGGVEEECGSAAGLRQYHEANVGPGTCNGCHSGDPTPVGEHIAPFNYAQGSNVIKDACNADGTESRFGPTGLDNDGDGQRDGGDSDCQANSPPTQPGTLSASMITTNSATVSWGASTDDDGDPITYQVDYRRNVDTAWSDAGSTSNTSQALSGLDAGQSYDVRVTPNDGTENGPSRITLNLFQTEPGGSLFNINAGHAGAWFNPEIPGQGQLVDVEPESKFLFLSWFTFTNAISENPNEQHWFTAQGNYSGDTADLLVYETLGGQFDDPQEVSTESVGTATLSFADCGNGQLDYTIDTWNVQGSFPLIRAIPGTENVCEERAGLSTESLEPDDGRDGAWYDAASPGQGFLIDAHPGNEFIFVAWFTYGDDTASGQRWLTAQGPLQDSKADIVLYETLGGSFDDPEPSETNAVGSMTIDFTDCSNALLTYAITDEALAGMIEIERAIPGTEALCEELTQ